MLTHIVHIFLFYFSPRHLFTFIPPITSSSYFILDRCFSFNFPFSFLKYKDWNLWGITTFSWRVQIYGFEPKRGLCTKWLRVEWLYNILIPLTHSQSEGRPNVAKYLFVLTDGRVTRGVEKMKEEAKRLKSIGVTSVAIAIGDDIDEQTLAIIANGDQANIFKSKDFKTTSENFIEAIIEKRCEQIGRK